MGERKGVNKYYPPDYDPSKGGLNKFLGTHALRERARKLHLGILIIRFEMPYNIWCLGCNNHIGMGVRYNAEKSKVGMYYSTPVYKFRMKCHLCDNHFEMQTDPANLDYIILNGARRQEQRWDPQENDQIAPEKGEWKHLASDPMFKLEHGVLDEGKSKDVAPALSNLEDLQESRWKDDFSANQALRQIFRKRKKELKLENMKDQELLKKSSLDIPLVAETKEDATIASLIKLQSRTNPEETTKASRTRINQSNSFPKSIFSSNLEEDSANASTSDYSIESATKTTASSPSDLSQQRLLLGIRPLAPKVDVLVSKEERTEQEEKNQPKQKQEVKQEALSSLVSLDYDSNSSSSSEES